MSELQQSLLEYPCDFPIKVMGRTRHGYAQSIIAVVKQHTPDFDASSVGMRLSREGTYMSLTLVVRVESREQLDALYRELCDHPMVSMVL
jgi:putative lipoic acid-binding regulatory protein